MRAELEALVTEEAARKLTPAALEELEECEKRFARLTREIRSHEPGGNRRALMGEWMRANHAFHDVLYRVAEMPYVESVAKAARRTFSGPTVWAPVDDELEALYERNQAEHRAIRQALAAGSVAGARELAREHVMHSFELLTTILAHVGADWARAQRPRSSSTATSSPAARTCAAIRCARPAGRAVRSRRGSGCAARCSRRADASCG